MGGFIKKKVLCFPPKSCILINGTENDFEVVYIGEGCFSELKKKQLL